MSYESLDRSASDSAPVELFTFTGRGQTYRYVNSDDEFEFDGETFLPTQISMGAIAVSDDLEGSMVNLTVPYDIDLARDFGYLSTPSHLGVTCRRVQRDAVGESEILFVGESVDYAIDGYTFGMRFGNLLQTRFAQKVRTVYIDTPCNHQLYDSLCGVSKAAHTTTSTVTVIGPTAITVADDGVANGELVGGEVTNTRTNERQQIIDNFENVLTIARPFIDIEIGDTVNMSKGCDRTFTTCINRFNNAANNGGFQYVPEKNVEDGG